MIFAQLVTFASGFNTEPTTDLMTRPWSSHTFCMHTMSISDLYLDATYHDVGKFFPNETAGFLPGLKRIRYCNIHSTYNVLSRVLYFQIKQNKISCFEENSVCFSDTLGVCLSISLYGGFPL